jgi:hypothetical protein
MRADTNVGPRQHSTGSRVLDLQLYVRLARLEVDDDLERRFHVR